VHTKRNFNFNKVTELIEFSAENNILGLTEEYQLPENTNSLKIQYFENDRKIFNSFNKSVSSKFDLAGIKLHNKKLSYRITDFKFSRLNKTFSLKQLQNSVNEKTYELTIISSSQIKTYFVSNKITIASALNSIPGGDEIRYDTDNWVLINTGTQSFNYQPEKGSRIFLVEITNDDQRLFYSNQEKETHRIIDGTFKFNSNRTYDVSIKLNGEMDYTLWGEHFTTIQSVVHLDFQCEIMEFWNKNYKQRINSRNMGKFFDLYLDNELTPMPLIQNNEIRIIDIPYHTEIELRIKHKFMQPAKQGYHLGRIGRSRRCDKDFIHPNGVKTAVKVREFNSLTFIDYQLEITRSLAMD
jgi:hypothetical protein